MPENGKLKVTVAQIETSFGELEANLAKHLAVIDDVRTKPVDVLMFPETSLVGHGAGADVLRIARDRNDEIVRKLATAAGNVLVIFGMVEEGMAAQFFNSVIAVQNGEIVFVHRKINLPTYGQLEDAKHFASGRYVETFEISDHWRAGVQICADVWNPALVWLAALHGATSLFIPVSSAIEAVGAEFDNPGGWDTVLRFYSMIYGMPVVMANRVGREGDLNFWGGSRILDPFGRELVRAGDKEQLISATLNYNEVRKARCLLPTVRDSNLGLVLRETERLSDKLGVPDFVRTG